MDIKIRIGLILSGTAFITLIVSVIFKIIGIYDIASFLFQLAVLQIIITFLNLVFIMLSERHKSDEKVRE